MPGKPIARHGSTILLYDHLRRVGGGVLSYFDDRLTARTGVVECAVEPIGLGYRSLLAAAVLSGLLHDIGKASNLYQYEIGSFHMHEWVSAVITYDASIALYDKGLERASNLLYLASHVIARHHAAMGRRHPSKLSSQVVGGEPGGAGEDMVNRVVEAIQKMDATVLRELLEDTGITGKLGKVLVDSLSRLKAQGPSSLREYVENTIYKLGLLTGGEDSLEGVMGSATCIGSIQAATGTLIVSDILAAGEEDKESRRRGYAVIWMRELEDIAETHSLGMGLKKIDSLVSQVESLLDRR